MKALLVAALLLLAAPAQAGPGDWRSFLPRLQGDARDMPPPGGRERSEERRRLREEVREGRLPRDEAVRQYRERFPERPAQERHRMSREEREQMRRDMHETNRHLKRR